MTLEHMSAHYVCLSLSSVPRPTFQKPLLFSYFLYERLTYAELSKFDHDSNVKLVSNLDRPVCILLCFYFSVC
jgi:hypothetical protein